MPRLPCPTRRNCARQAMLVIGLAWATAAAAQEFPQRSGSPSNVRPVQLSLDDDLEEPGRLTPSYDEPGGPSDLSDSDGLENVPPEDLLNAPLAEVKIEGNVTIPEYAILTHVRSRAGRPSNEHQIEEDVRDLINTRYFLRVTPTIRMSDKGPILVFQVSERPILRKVEFKGNKKIKTSELQAHTGLVTGHAYDVAANRECVERIRSLYREKGYLHAKVTLEKGDKQEERDVVFNIEEGPKVKVWDIRFEGNDEVRDGILKTKLATKTVILWLIGGNYDPDIVANDTVALKKYYADLGYFDAEVTQEVREKQPGKMEVVFKVAEGTRYRVRTQILEGNEVLSQKELFEDKKLESGKFFSARYLQQDVAKMKEKYDDLGRLFSTVEPTPRFLEDPGWVDVVYRVGEDQPRKIGMINIHIRGDHPHTREDVVRSQVNPFLKPGDLASGKNLRMVQARLQGSQYWDRTAPASVDVVPADVSRYVLAPSAARGQSQMESSAEGLDGVFSELSPTDWFGTQSQTSGYTPHVDSFDPPVRPQSQNVRDVRQGHSLAPPFDEGRSQVRVLPVTGRARVRQAAHEELSFEAGRSQLAGHSTSPLAATSRVAWAAEEEAPAASNAGFGFRGIPPEPIYRIDPEAIFSLAPEDITIRAQSPDDIVRAQSIDRNGNPIPQNYMGAVSPQGDPFGDSFNRPGEPAFVDVNIDVTEGRTGRLMFGVGVNSDAGVIGQFTLQEDNFDILRPPRSWADIINGQAWRGRGQSFRIEAMPGSQVSRFLVSWQDPFFLRSDYSFGVSGFFYNRFYNDWTEDRLGGRINVGRLLTRYWSVSAALRLENVDIHDFRTPAPQDLQDVAGDNFLSTGSVTVSHDSRDSAFLPTMGHLLEATYEQGFGEFNYPRVEGSASQYFTIWERPDGLGKHILSLRSQLGWSGDGTPIFERFYAGGYSSFRGFAFRGVTPHEAGITVGGQWMSLGTVEYMAPVTADDNIRVVGFSDFGTVDQDVSMDNFRLSLGFGVRMIIPAMGPAPIALDFAWPLLDEKTDDRRVFSFYVGFTR